MRSSVPRASLKMASIPGDFALFINLGDCWSARSGAELARFLASVSRADSDGVPARRSGGRGNAIKAERAGLTRPVEVLGCFE